MYGSQGKCIQPHPLKVEIKFEKSLSFQILSFLTCHLQQPNITTPSLDFNYNVKNLIVKIWNVKIEMSKMKMKCCNESVMHKFIAMTSILPSPKFNLADQTETDIQFFANILSDFLQNNNSSMSFCFELNLSFIIYPFSYQKLLTYN